MDQVRTWLSEVNPQPVSTSRLGCENGEKDKTYRGNIVGICVYYCIHSGDMGGYVSKDIN